MDDRNGWEGDEEKRLLAISFQLLALAKEEQTNPKT